MKGKPFPSSQEDGTSGLGADLTLQLMAWNIAAMNDLPKGSTLGRQAHLRLC